MLWQKREAWPPIQWATAEANSFVGYQAMVREHFSLRTPIRSKMPRYCGYLIITEFSAWADLTKNKTLWLSLSGRWASTAEHSGKESALGNPSSVRYSAQKGKQGTLTLFSTKNSIVCKGWCRGTLPHSYHTRLKKLIRYLDVKLETTK